MKYFLPLFLTLTLVHACKNEEKVISKKNAILLAQEYLEKCKKQLNTDSVKNLLAEYDFEKLSTELNSDAQKMTFWLNIYNASTQDYLAQKVNQLTDKEHFFNQKMILVAGEKVSLNEIENQILRRKSSKREVLQELNVRKLDPRIHFALNCGAKSCPSVLFYELNKLDSQLDLATEAYLQTECELKNGTIYLPMIFSWFKEDFGGEEGIFDFLRKYAIVQTVENPKVVYLEYDWELSLGNYN